MSSTNPHDHVLLRVATLPGAALTGLATTRAAETARTLATRHRVLCEAAAPLCDGLHAAVPLVGDSGSRGILLGLRRELYRKQTVAAGGKPASLEPVGLARLFSLVAPELFAALEHYGSEWDTLAAAERQAAEAFMAEDAAARERLREAFRPDFMRDLVALASGDLHASFTRYDAVPLARFGRRERRTESALAQLLARASLKTIPQGLVGASGLAAVASGSLTTLRLHPGGSPVVHRRTMLDGFVLARAAAWLSGDGLADALRPCINPSLYRKHDGDGCRTDRFVFWRDGGDGPERCEAQAHALAERFVELARSGTLTAAELVRSVSETPEPTISAERAWAFYRRLVREGLLLATLHLSAFPSDAFTELRGQLAGLPNGRADALIARLARVEELLAAVDRAKVPWAERSHTYRELGTEVRGLYPEAPTEPHELLVVDAVVESTGALSGAIIGELERAVWWYLRVADPLHERICTRRPGAAALVTAFLARFGHRRVPLGEAADALAALPQGSGDHLTWPRLPGENSPEARFAIWLTARVAAAADARDEQVSVAEADLDGFGFPPERPGPAAVDVVFSIGADATGSPDHDAWLVLDLLSYPGALSARVADLFDGPEGPPLACGLMARLAEWRPPSPRAVLAEIAATLDRPRAANAGRRPRLTPFEIAVSAPSSRPRGEVLDVEDLVVEPSPEADRLVLWSQRLARPVEPVFHSALDPSFDRVVALLCQLGTLTTPTAPLFRRFALDRERPRYAPRVTLGRVVLSRRRWELSPAQFPPRDADGWRGFAAVQEWRATHGLPRWVWATVAAEGRPLPLDLECPLLLRGIFRWLDGASLLDLEEMLPAPPAFWLRSGLGAHAFQALVTLPLRARV